MLDFLVTLLLVTLFVLGIFGIVQWVMKFFPRANSVGGNLHVAKWWIALLLVTLWLNTLSQLIGSLSAERWTKDEYLNIFYFAGLSYCFVYVVIWPNRPRRLAERDNDKRS